MQSDARHGAELCVADDTPPCEARQSEASRRHNGQVSKFTKMNHFTDGERSLRLWRNAVMVPSRHWRGTLARVCRCRPIWTPRESTLGELRNTSPQQEEKLQIKDRECIALKHLIKCGVRKEA